ncbi:MAG: UvrD-helicase domain-containing protein [Clostridiales bacterium]|nr:UvrD-helicase domain-containing protein [Clostridiales bacterium]
MSNEVKYTPSQQNVISFRGKNMLVSASAGTGKTTVMIERIAALIEEGEKVDEMVVVTFTNLAAAQMKARLAEKLSKKRNNPRVVEALENIDSASICTLHSFCSELLRNYFYVLDIDPAFAILDDATVSTIKSNVLDTLFQEYFSQDDEVFRQVYKIFSSKRKEENFRKIILRLYSFSRCLENFGQWYGEKKENFLNYSENNPIIRTILDDVSQMVKYYHRNLVRLADNSRDEGLTKITAVLEHNADVLNDIKLDNLEDAIHGLTNYKFKTMPPKDDSVPMTEVEEQIRAQYVKLRDKLTEYRRKYAALFRVQNGETLSTLWEENRRAQAYTGKLAEIVVRFDEAYFEAKKQRGGVDYDDLEHLCLKLLDDDATRMEIRSRYRYIFVDEYQDTNPIQEAIVRAISSPDNLFMVGDVKQSIYGFRGCEPSIFTDKYSDYKATDKGRVEELNDNFRTNTEILDFVNFVFNRVMTNDFGKVDYRVTAQLKGPTQPTLSTPSTRVDVLVTHDSEQRQIDDIYDITATPEKPAEMSQGELIARRIKEYVGKAYTVEEKNEHGEKVKVTKHINYGDIVILMRGMKDKALDVYNAIVANNIPATANFNADGLSTKEIKDLVNLFRVLDNPYNDVSIVGACLSPLGGFTEAELGNIRLDTKGRIPFYKRLLEYAKNGENSTWGEKKRELGWKIRQFLNFLDDLRFYSRSASVDEVSLRVLQKTNYHLYVQGLPNGALRIRKLYAFIDSLNGASYAQSIDKFLSYIDETENSRADEGLSQSGAVRIMTMHASKGLEFPIVFVAGVESPIKFDYYAVEQNSDLGLATRYYDFDDMKKAETLEFYAARLVNHNKQREEEMRLLYVALTRAKYLLNIVATVSEADLKAFPTLPNRASSHLDWLLPTVLELRDTDKVKGLDINIPPTFDEQSPQEKNVELIDKTKVDAASIERQLSYVYQYRNETQMPSKIVSSALDKEYIDLTDEPREEFTLSADNDRNFVGTAYHKLYQYVSYDATVEQIRQTLDELVASGKVEQRFAEQIDVDLVFETLHNQELLALLDGGKVYHEIPFMLSAPYSQVAKDKRFNDEVMLQGVIDLLVIKKDSAVVIDFKYTSRSDLVEERYTMQLNSYKLAVERIMGIADVETYVLSIADNKLIKM